MPHQIAHKSREHEWNASLETALTCFTNGTARSLTKLPAWRPFYPKQSTRATGIHPELLQVSLLKSLMCYLVIPQWSGHQQRRLLLSLKMGNFPKAENQALFGISGVRDWWGEGIRASCSILTSFKYRVRNTRHFQHINHATK